MTETARKADPLEARCRELAVQNAIDPDSRVAKEGSARGMPAWCLFRDRARAEQNVREAEEAARVLRQERIGVVQGQRALYADAPLLVLGEHEEATIAQMRNCMAVGNVVGGVICADGHLGYAQPVGGVVAYENQISISGVGFDIGCGNMAVRLDMGYGDIKPYLATILREITKVISFGVGRTNDERVEDELFDHATLWDASGMADYKAKARQQLGTVGSGNHYVNLFRDESNIVWIGVHFGSRGLGHTAATRWLKAAGGKDGMHVPPAVVDVNSEIGERYLAAMRLAGQYTYAGRAWVVERVRKIIRDTTRYEARVTDAVHNHHNYAWLEQHGGKRLWVVRKGATPAFPGQEGFVGGSMGDNAVILEGVERSEARRALYSTIHGAGRLYGRMAAKRTFTRAEMDAWLREKGVLLAGGDLDESPMAYRRLPDVLKHHKASVRVKRILTPIAVAMAGPGVSDPFKD